ncbi:MAG: catalase family peroxidase [Acidobacteriota bacterium]
MTNIFNERYPRNAVNLWLTICAMICGVFQMTADAQKMPDQKETTPETFVDAQNSVFGKQTTNRSTHAKGIVLLGKFTPNAAAKKLSKAPHFQQAVPITVRFSDNTGIPTLPDAAPLASPHGMSIKFHLPDGTETDLVMHSYNGFPARNADEMRRFFMAIGASGDDVPSPKPIEKFMAEYPAAKAFLTTQDPPPVSYATIAYFGVNSFKFINSAGSETFIRYQIIPKAGKHFLTKEEITKAAPDYLLDELRGRVAKMPIRFTFRVQLFESGDKIDDPSIAWSDKNKTVDLGVIEITQIVPDNDATNHALLFMPGLLPDGIEPADPMIQFRNKTYPVSYNRRHQQK